MKILGINASPKGSKSETLKLVKAVLNGVKSKAPRWSWWTSASCGSNTATPAGYVTRKENA